MRTERAEHGVKRGSEPPQKAKRDNNLAIAGPVCKTGDDGDQEKSLSFLKRIPPELLILL
jgi:hypothetical protein